MAAQQRHPAVGSLEIQNHPMTTAAVAMAPVAAQPVLKSQPRTANSPIIEDRDDANMVAAMIGTTISPFTTALQ